MRRTLIYSLTIFLSFAASGFAPTATADNLVLNGSASYFHLTRDYYLGGLYLPTKSDDIDYIHAARTAKRMQIIIQVPSWTPRRWSQIWQNNIAINNENLSPSAQMQQALITFTSFPRAELKAGDEIIIDYQPNGNSRVLLNGDLVIEVPGTEFFNYMVNTWVGTLPPTREFRQQILGQSQANDKQVDTLLKHRPNRTGLWAGWIAAEEAQRLAQEEETQRLAQEAAAEKRRAEEAARRAEQQRQQEEQARIAAAQLAAQQAQAKVVAAPKVTASAPTTTAKAAPAPVTTPKTNQASLQALADEQRYFLDMLQWDLQRKVEANVSYPAWAKQFGQEGHVVIDFRLHKNNEISDVQIRDASLSDILISEVQRAIRTVSPNIAIPQQLAGESWLLKAHYQFSLQGNKQAANTMPVAPASLQKSVGKVDSKQLEESYRQQQSERILEAVVYPPAARILKKQDRVSVEVTLDKSGAITSIKEVKNSRHRELNQALTDAIKKSEPFPAFPLGLTADSITLMLEYDFKL